MELKFRAWHKEHKRYYDVLQILLDLETVLLNDLLNAFECDLDEVIIEQFTGCKDKNGTEIYTNDLIGGYRFYSDDTCYDEEIAKLTADYAFGSLEDMKIIGNIHENKEELD